MRAKTRWHRAVIVAMAGAAVAAASAPPAVAKIDLRAAVISGPGLDRPITLRGEAAWTFFTGGWASGHPPDIAAVPSRPGPAYPVRLVNGPMEADWRAWLYPFAEGGPVLRLGASRDLIWMLEGRHRPGRTGWVEVAERQLDVLRRHGFPATDPTAGAAIADEEFIVSAAPAAPEQRPATAAIAVGLGGVAAGLLGLGMRRLARRRNA